MVAVVEDLVSAAGVGCNSANFACKSLSISQSCGNALIEIVTEERTPIDCLT